jgi:hypothetical protein
VVIRQGDLMEDVRDYNTKQGVVTIMGDQLAALGSWIEVLMLQVFQILQKFKNWNE